MKTGRVSSRVFDGEGERRLTRFGKVVYYPCAFIGFTKIPGWYFCGERSESRSDEAMDGRSPIPPVRPSVKFHDLRATFITNLLARGESLARVMAMVGHSQIKTTNGYLRKAGVEVQGGTDKLGYKLPDENLGENVIFLKRPK